MNKRGEYKVKKIISCILLLLVMIMVIFSSFYFEKEDLNVISAKEISYKLKENDDNIFIYFYKKGCPPCGEQKKVFNDIMKEKKINLYAIDAEVESNVQFLEDNNINSTPTIFVYKKNKMSARFEGVVSKKEILELDGGK